jgi:anionic cell wall polymer biosynthesis LytR-Cps2A-Psr (LCP) family protein
MASEIKKKKKKKKKKGVAIPFLITILISMIVIGIPAYYGYQYLTTSTEDDSDDGYYGNYKAKAEDSCTILFILDLNETDGQDTFVLLRAMPIVNSFACVPIANSTMSSYENNVDTIGNIYLKNGINGIKTAVENSFSIKVDKYIKLNEQSFQKICDILGGVNYYIPQDVKGFNRGQMYMSSKQIQDLITHYEFTDEERCYIVGSVITSMLSQAMGERVAENLDTSFESLINLMDTDVTTIDYKNGKKAIQYMFNSDEYICQYKIPTGSYNSDNQFVISEDFKVELAEWFSGVLETTEDVTGVTYETVETTVIYAPDPETTGDDSDDGQLGEKEFDYDAGDSNFEDFGMDGVVTDDYSSNDYSSDDYSSNDDYSSDDYSSDDNTDDYSSTDDNSNDDSNSYSYGY